MINKEFTTVKTNFLSEKTSNFSFSIRKTSKIIINSKSHIISSFNARR